MEGKSDDSFNVDVRAQGYSLSGNGGHIESTLVTEKEIELEVVVSST